MSELVVEIRELRTAVERVLNTVERVHGESVEIPYDYYWHLWAATAFDLTDEPTSLTAGQVSDDLAEVQAYVRRDPGDDEIAIWHDLHHVIGLLRAIERVSTP